jgi:hypothetical protein
VRWALRVLTLAAVAATAIMGGQRYLYCRAMGEIMTDTTCSCAQPKSSEDGAVAIGPRDCFEVRQLHRLVSFTIASDFVVPPAGLVATLPAPVVDTAPSSAVLTYVAHPIRAGPFSPTSRRSQLMVFLT